MHWLWRALIAVAVGFVFALFSANSVRQAGPLMRQAFDGSDFEQIHVVSLWIVPTIIVIVASFGIATCYLKSPRDRETRCRKCGYILRGIPEPRCSECGERI